MMMKIPAPARIVMIILLVWAQPLSAGDETAFDYHYLEAAYTGQSPSRTAPNFSGGTLRGAFGFENRLFLHLELRNTTASHDDTRLDERLLGLGFASKLDQDLDLVTRFDLIAREFDLESVDGFAFNTGVRWRLHPRIETDGFIAWRSLDNESEWFGHARLLGRIAGPVWLSLGALHGERDRIWEAGLRLNY